MNPCGEDPCGASPRWPVVLSALLLLALVGTVLYWPVIKGGVWVFDDFDYILEDPAIRHLTAYLHDVFEPRYVGFLSFAFNYAIGGTDPTSYHVVNVAIHVINAFLTAVLASRFLCSEGAKGGDELRVEPLLVAFTAGFLFLVHPMQTQAVAYVTQRLASLATLFYLLAVVLYIDARRLGEADQRDGWRRGLYAASVLSCVAAMKTKEIAFTVPLVLALVEFSLFRQSRHGVRRYVFLVPYVVAASIIPISLFAPSLGLGTDGPQIYERMRVQKQSDLTGLSSYVYFVNQLRVAVIYLRLLVFPSGLSLAHEIDVSSSLLDQRVILSSGVLGAIVFLALWAASKCRRGGIDAPYYRCVFFGVSWLFVTASVESSFIPIKDLIFEHRVYLPSAGFFLAAVALAALALRRIPQRPAKAVLALVLVAGVTGALGTATAARTRVWTDEVGVWDDALRQSPRSFAAYHNRGVAHFLRGNYRESLESLNQAIELFHQSFQRESAWRDPSLSPENVGIAFGFRARVLALSGNREAARVDFNHVRNLARTLAEPARLAALMAAIAEVFVASGYPEDAAEQYSEALALRPVEPSLYFGRAIARGEAGDFRGAAEDLTGAIALDPEVAPAYFNRAYFLDRLGDDEGARADLGKACELGFELACETLRDGWPEGFGETEGPAVEPGGR